MKFVATNKHKAHKYLYMLEITQKVLNELNTQWQLMIAGYISDGAPNMTGVSRDRKLDYGTRWSIPGSLNSPR